MVRQLYIFRIWLRFELVLGLSFLPLLYSASSPSSTAPIVNLQVHRSKLRKYDREQLSAALVEGRERVMISIASSPGQNTKVAAYLESVGGRVRFREDEVDYVRAETPVQAVQQISQLDVIDALDVVGPSTLHPTSKDLVTSLDASPNDVSIQEIAAPGPNTPAENPFLPTQDIGAPQFIAEHPTYDGRGVTICVLEPGPADMLVPELQDATTLDGRTTRKMIDVIDAIDPLDDDSWRVRMSEQVVAKGGSFSHQGVRYVAPSDGEFRIGIFHEIAFEYPPYDTIVNKQSTPKAGKGRFAVLWNERFNTVWVDTNQNNDFSDELPIRDYNLHYEVGRFGRDDPATPIRESIGFLVLVNTNGHFIDLVPLFGGHPTSSTSVAVGRRFFGGRMNGAAPGAQVISMLLGSGISGQIEGMILAAKHPKVDVVTMEYAMVSRLNDGNSTESVIFDRLVERYKKPIFISADNGGPAVATISENASASKVITVGGYVSRDTWRSNYGVSVNDPDYIISFSSRGPRKDGGFKPDILAPAAVVAVSDYVYAPVRGPGDPYALPPGYIRGAGTSDASPIAAGAAALLISAAKQTGVPYDSARLKWAIKTTARHLQGWGAHEQGDGLFQVEQAWNALRRSVDLPQIESVAPVRTLQSNYLRVPNQGPGIYEREGWVSGQSAERSIRFRRLTGKRGAITYNVRWVGDKSTFSSALHIALPLGVPVLLQVAITCQPPGVHSAILHLDEVGGSENAYEIMNTVVCAQEFGIDKRFRVDTARAADFPSYSSMFLRIPSRTNALNIRTGEVTTKMQVSAVGPADSRTISATGGSGLSVLEDGNQVIISPEEGVWEIVFDHGNPFSFMKQPPETHVKLNFTIEASISGTEIEPMAPVTLDVGGRTELTASMTNRLSAFVGNTEELSLGSGTLVRATLEDGGPPKIYEVSLPSGTDSFRTRITPIDAAADADLDLYVYDCSQKRCFLKGSAVGPGTNESITVRNTTAGLWKVVIDPVRVHSGSVNVEYVDVFTNPLFGRLKTNAVAKIHTSGENWSESLSAEAEASALGNHRYLAALVGVKETALGPAISEGRSVPPRNVVIGGAKAPVGDVELVWTLLCVKTNAVTCKP
jgi:subtilisin family serine protease